MTAALVYVAVILVLLVPILVSVGKSLYDSWRNYKKSFDVPNMQDPDPDDWKDEDKSKWRDHGP